jgi:hypothetical protein
MPHNLTQPSVYTDFSSPSQSKHQLATAKVTILRKINDLLDDSDVTRKPAQALAPCSSPRQHVCPFGANALFELPARARHAGKAIAP